MHESAREVDEDGEDDDVGESAEERAEGALESPEEGVEWEGYRKCEEQCGRMEHNSEALWQAEARHEAAKRPEHPSSTRAGSGDPGTSTYTT